MLQIKHFIDIYVPVHVCNLKCNYCYVSQYEENSKAQKQAKFNFLYSPEHVKKCLTQERLGGVCHFNMCGSGETLIPRELADYVRVILENGHSVMIVTNGLLTDRFEKLMELPKELKSRLGFKFSFHYLELKRTNQMEIFFNNINLVRKNGCSFSLELTANDEYEPYIEDIKALSLKKVGALCHITIPRNEPVRGIPLLSKHSLEEFYDVWKEFDSPMLDNKKRYWGEKRKEYCLAGEVSALLDLEDGAFKPCYKQKYMTQNIFKDPEKPIKWCAVGKTCKVEHCFNDHSFLAFGDIPELEFCNYNEIRDRVDKDGKHWINEEMREHFSQKIISNSAKSFSKKCKYKFRRGNIKFKNFCAKAIRKIKK